MLANKTKILGWVIILLAVLNITTIITIVVHNNDDKNAEESILVEPDTAPINGRYFRHELGFDNDQMKVFRQCNKTFRHQANQIVADIYKQKVLMFDELQRTDPDTIKLDAIAKKIGLLHAELKKATGQYYLSLNCVCDARQKEKMKEIFTPLFINLPIRCNNRECKYGESSQ